MSALLPQPGGSAPRAEIVIKPHFRYGARVFLNQGGGVTVEQTAGCDGEAQLVFDCDEAVAVAEALLEVVRAAGQTETEGQHGTS